MANSTKPSLIIFIASLFITLTFALDPPVPVLPAPYASPPAPPADMPDYTPAPAPSEGGPAMSPAPASDNSPVPTPADVSADEYKEKGDGKMGGGSKAGIVVGVAAAMVVLGVGGIVLKKRRDNIRRAQYASAARREFLGDL